MQHLLVLWYTMEYSTRQLYCLDLHSPNGSCVYLEDASGSQDIMSMVYIRKSLKSVAQLVLIAKISSFESTKYNETEKERDDHKVLAKTYTYLLYKHQ